MKAGTAARLLNLAVAIAIALIVLVPAAQSILENDMQLPEMGTQAVYDLGLMDEDSLENNLERAVSGRTGCTVEYGSEKADITGSDLTTLSKTIIDSGAESAVVRGPDGKILVQDRIDYRNDLIVGLATGVQMPGMAGSVTRMDLSTRLISEDGKVDMFVRGYGNGNPDEIGAVCVIPLIVYNIAAGYGCNMGQVVSLDYEGMATIDIDIGIKNSLKDGCTYSVSKVDGIDIITVSDCPYYWSGTARIGDVEITCLYTDMCAMTMSCTGSIADTLERALVDGCLTITLGDGEYRMDETLSSSFISTIKTMEATP